MSNDQNDSKGTARDGLTDVIERMKDKSSTSLCTLGKHFELM